MANVSIPISGDTPASVQLISLIRIDLNAAPAGVVLPLMLLASNGEYAAAFADPEPGLSYRGVVRITWDDETYDDQWIDFSGDGVSAGAPSYLDVASADAIAATMFNVSSYTSAATDRRLAAIVEATSVIDSAYVYQGRKFDPLQPLEFPRIAYDSGISHWRLGTQMPGLHSRREQIWDWDETTKAAVVPNAVLRAVVYQANSLLAGDRDDRVNAIHDGLASQSIGSAAESYRGGVAVPLLCLPADRLMRPYRIRQGRLL